MSFSGMRSTTYLFFPSRFSDLTSPYRLGRRVLDFVLVRDNNNLTGLTNCDQWVRWTVRNRQWEFSIFEFDFDNLAWTLIAMGYLKEALEEPVRTNWMSQSDFYCLSRFRFAINGFVLCRFRWHNYPFTHHVLTYGKFGFYNITHDENKYKYALCLNRWNYVQNMIE